MTWVDDLIRAEGVELTLIREAGGDVDPVTGKRATSTSETFKPFGFPSKDSEKLAKLVNGVSLNDRTFKLDTTVQPELGDLITIEGQTFTVREIDIPYMDGKPACFVVGLVK